MSGLHIVFLTPPKKARITSGPDFTKTQDVTANQTHLSFGNNIEQHLATPSTNLLAIISSKRVIFFRPCACRRGNKQILPHVVFVGLLQLSFPWENHPAFLEDSAWLDIPGTQHQTPKKPPAFAVSNSPKAGGRWTENGFCWGDLKPHPCQECIVILSLFPRKNSVQIDSKYTKDTSSAEWSRSLVDCYNWWRLA